jgi:hypothetical protein
MIRIAAALLAVALVLGRCDTRHPQGDCAERLCHYVTDYGAGKQPVGYHVVCDCRPRAGGGF